MKILFVCTGNAHRSPVAEALMKKFRPDIKADSAGIVVSIPISEEARNFLTGEDALQCLKSAPESLNSKKLEEYDLIVAMENMHKDAVLARCPRCAARLMVWDIDDPYYLPEEASEGVFRQIRDKVEQLAKSLQKGHG
jgi:protein-tyrosine phosphatase